MKYSRIVWGTAIVAGLSFMNLASAATPPIRIMPLGDSITYGSNTGGGYRLPLYIALTNAGYNVDFVGTQTANGATGLPDSDHEGHSGWKISDPSIGLYENILGWLSVIPDPDVVLLHIGTNDSGGGTAFTNAVDRLDALITRIAVTRPYAHIIVTSLMPRGETANTAITNYFNPFIPGKVAAQQALGRKVHFLDMHAYLTTNDMFDALHPNATGYVKMASAWLPAITNVIGATGDSSAPALVRAVGGATYTQVAVTFSKPVDPAGATNIANYALSNGLTLSGASLSADQRTVTLNTSLQIRGANYVVTVSNVADATSAPGPLTIAANSAISFMGAIPRGYQNNIAESAAYNLVYSLDVANTVGYGSTMVPYTTDNHLLYGGTLHRIAYYMELQPTNGNLTYLWASMDAFTNDTAMIGVPALATGAVFQRYVSNLTVDSNDPGVTKGSNFTGNIEFWPSNYDALNSANIAGASATLYDFGDHPTAGTYGCMQIHNATLGKTLFAFNNWGGGGATPDIGIGNDPAPIGGGVDWTFAVNGNQYIVKTIQVLVLRDNDTTPPTLVSAQAGIAGNLVSVAFSESLAPDSVDGTCFTLNNGVEVLSATLLPDLRTVNLVTTPQPLGAALTLTVTGIRDSAGGNPVTPGSSIGVTAATVPPPEITANVGSLANGYRLIYTLDIPVKGNFIGTPNFYRINQNTLTGSFDRVAYYIELKQANGNVQYLWTSMDAFTPYLSQIGVPTAASKAIFQKPVSNLDVLSNVAGITNGTAMAGGNLEFWPNDYSQGNAMAVPGASDSTFDFGDTRSSVGSHGSMQVHNSAAKQTLFGISNWGSDNQLLGIGIGNQSVNSPDWTQSYNAGTAYARRTLHILARPGGLTNGLPAEVATNVPAAAGYQLVYSITNIPVNASFSTNSPAYYAVNNLTNIQSFSRIAYYLEVQKSSDPSPKFIWTSMDAFTTDARKIGVPTNNCVFQVKVTNLDVLSNVGGIVNGNGIATGNIEFWPSDYNAANAANIPNASATAFDFGDNDSGGNAIGYGSMQVHNYGLGATQTLFAVNSFNNNNIVSLGIGTQPTGNPDWTHAYNAASYNRRVLHVFVLPNGDMSPDTTRPTLATATGVQSLNRATLYFSEALSDSAATPSFYTFTNGGVTVTGATLAMNKQSVTLTTTPQTAGQTYTVAVTGVRDRSLAGNPILPGSTIAFTAPTTARPNVLTNVAEAAGYTLIHQLAISNVTSYAFGANYQVDESLRQTQPFDRVAYCLELTVTNGVSKWVYVSMDAFTADLSKIGVPTANRGAMFQQYVSNLNVYAYSSDGNVAVTTGVGIAAGNIEFWPSNYGAANDKNIPGALGVVNTTNYYDWGDGGGPVGSTAGHGCMQIHNFAAGHTILSLSHIGSNNTNPGLGIGNNPTPNLPANYDLDYTFTYNAPAYTVKNLYVLAHWGNTPAALLAGTLPVLSVQPVGRTVHPGDSVKFYIQATGATAYQWRRNGVWIPGATHSWLDVSAARQGDAGVYDVLAFGSGSAYTASQSATLNVIPPGTLLKVR